MFTSVISNLAGNPKKPVKPDALYIPHLGPRRKREVPRTPEEERVMTERLLKQYEGVMNKGSDA